MPLPTISVIVPTYEGPERLAVCLAAIAVQDYSRDAWELIVVDDGTTDSDRVAAAVEAVRDRIDVRLITQPNSGPGKARNRGVGRARFEYVAFTDDDCRPHPRWLSELAASFERTPDVVLGGSVVNGLGNSLYSEASQLLVEYVIDYSLRSDKPFFPSNNLALSRATFEGVGGFDVRFPLAAGEDRDLCAKLRKFGSRFARAQQACVEHYHVLHMRPFWRQHYNYGRGAFTFRKLEEERGAGPPQVEPWKFYLDLLLAPSRSSWVSRGRLRLSALLFVSQVANAAGYYAERLGWSAPRRVATPCATSEVLATPESDYADPTPSAHQRVCRAEHDPAQQPEHGHR